MTPAFNHPAFPKPAEPNARIWRYLDASKFEWLVQCGRLFMPSADHLGDDPLEGTQPQGDASWWQSQIASASSGEQRSALEHNRNLLTSFAAKFRANYYYVSCWHLNPHECEAMWRSYTQTTDAVAIHTTLDELQRQLPAYVEVGMVRYIDFATERLPTLNLFEYVTHKNSCYAFEQEVRAVAPRPDVKEPGAAHFRENLFESDTVHRFHVFAPPVDAKQLVQGVLLHPNATSSYGMRVREICAKYGLPLPAPSSIQPTPSPAQNAP